MRTYDTPLYDSSLIGVMTRLTHSIIFDAGQRADQEPPQTSTGTPSAEPGWLHRLDAWFWKQDMKQREAFLARSLDVFDLEHRMRTLERGDKWLGTDRVDSPT